MAELALDISANEAAGRVDQSSDENLDSASNLLQRAQAFADELARRPNLGLQTAPLPEIERLAELGLLIAPLPRCEGGLALGVEPGSQKMLLRVLAAVGGGDLALGRLYEGHVNGLLMVIRYGSPEQVKRLAKDCRRGMLSGVWNTGVKELMRIDPEGDEVFRYDGIKTFATGATFVRRPIVTAYLPEMGWQMTMPRMELMDVKIDRSFWHPLGMESSESYGIDFTGERLEKEDLIGQPGDFYKDPLFRGGAIRFAAVQAGAAMRLHALFADWLKTKQRGDDPYQVARLGEVSMLSQQAALWVERAASVAEECLFRDDEPRQWRMVECANMTRLAIEKICTQIMHLVTTGVGAHGLLQPARFERVIRDLTMYLRQPAPDQAMADLGRASLRVGDDVADRFWNDRPHGNSLSPEYFRRVYEQNPDPWDFKLSGYEAAKYGMTLECLPLERYRSVLEVGCSIGVLTEKLASRCDSVLGLDVSDRAIAQARERLAGLQGVEVRKMQFPEGVPEGIFDLVVISEVGYYWHLADLVRAADRVAPMQTVGAHLVLVHWIPQVEEYPLTGDAVHDYWISRPEWRVVRSLRQERFRLEVFERR